MRSLQTRNVLGLSREYKSRKKQFDVETPALISWSNIEPLHKIKGKLFPFNQEVLVFPQWWVSIEKNNEHLKNKLLVFFPKIFPNVPELFPQSMKEEMDYYIESLKTIDAQNFNYISYIPDQLVATEYFDQLIELDPTAIFILFSYDWKSSPSKFVETIIRTRLKTPNDIALGLGGIIPPYLYAPLVYLGIDIIDASWTLWTCSQKIAYFKGKEVLLDSNNLIKKIIQEREMNLCDWNLSQAKEEIIFVRELLQKASLRDYVESLVYMDPLIAFILRHSKKFQELFLNHIPITGNPIFCPTELSLDRPEIIAFHERVDKRFIPRSTPIVVILPCSHKKPYFVSQSHQKYGKVLRAFYKSTGIFPEKIIVTSPMGAVPGDLDVIYPVAHYDIPVTGEWTETEIKTTASYLAKLLKKYPKNTKFVIHTSKDYEAMIKEGFKETGYQPFTENYFEKPYSTEALNKLYQELFSAFDSLENIVKESAMPNVNVKQEYVFKLRGMANYQYGLGVGDEITAQYKDIVVRGKYPRDVAFFGGDEKLATLSFSTNKIVLSTQLIRKIWSKIENKVWFEGDQIKGSSIFIQGIIDASPEIRPQDEVIILSKNNKLLAVGTAILPGDLMKIKGSGVAIKIRKKVF